MSLIITHLNNETIGEFMKKVSIKFLAFSLTVLSSVSTYAADADFLGTWVNMNPNTTGIVKIEISTGLSMKMWGACTPTPCDNGSTPLVTYGANSSDTNHKAATGQYVFSFKKVETTLKIISPVRLNFEHFNQFTDGSIRQNYWMLEKFKKLNSSTDMNEL